MHPTPTPLVDSSTSNTSTTTGKPSRLRLRGFSYLRGHQSSLAAASSAHNSSVPEPGNRIHLQDFSTPQPGSPAFTPPSPVGNNSLPILSQQDSQQNGYFDRSLGSPSLPSLHPHNSEERSTSMARDRTGTVPNVRRASENGSSNLAGLPHDQMPTIRLICHQDPRSSRPSLAFPTTSRTLPHEECVVRVGRYSERDTNTTIPHNTPSSAPVGFKSKVVSRRHCEFWCSNGQWYIKDVKSSSGTFLNHIRLSQPSMESKPFPVHDGDVVQLGIDFRGGEEQIFRCVKIRVECNRAWQKTLNNYK